MKRNSVHFSSHLPINETSNRMELRNMFKYLVSDPSTRTADTLRTIRKSLKRTGDIGLSADQDKNEYFQLFYELLGDQKWRITCECTMLMVDLIPQMSEYELDHCMSLVLPRIIPNLGHSSTDVRRASLRLLHVYMRYTNNLQKVLRLYIKYGLQNREKPSQKGAVLSLPLLFTEEFSNENLFPLVDCLADLLISTDTTLFYPVFLALQRIHSLVGRETFRLYLDHVRQEAVLLYQRVLSRNNSLATSGGRSETVDISLEPTHGDKFTSIDRLIGYSEPPSSFEAREDEMTSKYAFGTSFGIFPKLLVRRAESESLPDRLDALSQMVIVIQESPQSQIHLFSQHFDDFLRNFVAELIENNSYKLTLYAYDLLESAIERLKTSAVNSLSLVTSLLLKRLGDSRVVVREYNIKVLYRIMFSLPPQMILDSLLENKFHRNPKVREEILNRVSAGVMMFPRSEFNLPRLVNHVSPLLLDSKRCVRIAALEAMAVLGQALGPANIETMLRTVRSLELSRSAPGLLNAVQARLLRHELPKCSPDGTVKHYINRLTCATWIPHESDADMEWVMMGALGHRSDPSCSHISRSCTRRKSSMVLPQVSFEQPSSDSTEKPNKEEHWSGQRKVSADFSSDARIFTERKERHKHIVSPDSSSTSDSTKEREMWRYYFMSFQRNMEVWKSDDAGNSRGNHRPTSVSSNTSCDSGPRTSRRGFLDADSDAKNQRALSMPTIASGNLSDISEQSHEDFLGRRIVNRGNRRRSSHRLPNSEPSSPERRPSIVDTLCIGPRSKSVAARVPTPEPAPETLTLPNQHSFRRESNSSTQGQNDEERKVDENRETSRPVSATSDVTGATTLENAHVAAGEMSKEECRTPQEAQKEEESRPQKEGSGKKDAQTQMYESDSSNGCFVLDHHDPYQGKLTRENSRFQTVPPRRKCCRKYLSRSKSPGRNLRYHTRIQPAIASNIDIYGILENVAKTEGAFISPEDALKAVIAAFSQDAWTTKVESMLAISRLATYHPNILQRELHTIVQALVYEVKNLRSTVSRSAIYTLGDLMTKMKRSIEPEIDMIAQALLHKCSENTTFIRDDIDKALTALVDEMPQTKSILALIHGGAHHRSVAVRKTAAHYICLVVDKMGANKCLVGPRDVAEHLLPAAAKFVMDPSPVTRFYGRSIFHTVQSHPQFEKLMRRHLSPGTFRNIHGILESLKRRGPGDRPLETAIKA